MPSAPAAAGKTYAQIGDSRLDWALEREAELVRLEEENRRLRELMGLDVDHLDPATTATTTTTAAAGAAGGGDDDAREGRGGAPAPAEKPVFGLSGGLSADDVLAGRPETAGAV